MRRVLLWVLAANLAVAAAKFGYGVWARSVAVQADALHSTFDGLANLVGLGSITLAAAPPDREHPYGHHRYELLGALGIAVLIAATGVGIGWEAVSSLGEPNRVRMNLPGLALICVVAAVSFTISRYENRVGNELNSPVLLADAAHTMTDVFGTGVVLAASIGIYLGVGWLDVPAALIVAAIVGHAAWEILRDAIDVLLETAAVPREDVERAALSVEGVHSCHKIRSRGTPGSIFVDLHIQVDPWEPVGLAHDRSGAVKVAIMQEIPGVADVLVHIEPDDGHGEDTEA